MDGRPSGLRQLPPLELLQEGGQVGRDGPGTQSLHPIGKRLVVDVEDVPFVVFPFDRLYEGFRDQRV